jgi:hypothetical protein
LAKFIQKFHVLWRRSAAKGSNLGAHHVQNAALHPENRFERHLERRGVVGGIQSVKGVCWERGRQWLSWADLL